MLVKDYIGWDRMGKEGEEEERVWNEMKREGKEIKAQRRGRKVIEGMG